MPGAEASCFCFAEKEGQGAEEQAAIQQEEPETVAQSEQEPSEHLEGFGIL